MKKGLKGMVSLLIIEKWRGFWEKMPSSSSSRRRGTEEGEGGPLRWSIPATRARRRPGTGEKREGGEANRSPASPCAGVERGGPATEASSGGWRC